MPGCRADDTAVRASQPARTNASRAARAKQSAVQPTQHKKSRIKQNKTKMAPRRYAPSLKGRGGELAPRRGTGTSHWSASLLLARQTACSAIGGRWRASPAFSTKGREGFWSGRSMRWLQDWSKKKKSFSRLPHTMHTYCRPNNVHLGLPLHDSSRRHSARAPTLAVRYAPT